MGRGLRLRLGGRLGCEALCSPPQSGAARTPAPTAVEAALPQTCPQEFSQAQCPAPPFIPPGQDTQVTWALALGVV